MALRDYRWFASFVGVSLSTARTWVQRGQVPHLRLSPRVVRFDEDAVRVWLESKAAVQ